MLWALSLAIQAQCQNYSTPSENAKFLGPVAISPAQMEQIRKNPELGPVIAQRNQKVNVTVNGQQVSDAFVRCLCNSVSQNKVQECSYNNKTGTVNGASPETFHALMAHRNSSLAEINKDFATVNIETISKLQNIGQSSSKETLDVINQLDAELSKNIEGVEEFNQLAVKYVDEFKKQKNIKGDLVTGSNLSQILADDILVTSLIDIEKMTKQNSSLTSNLVANQKKLQQKTKAKSEILLGDIKKESLEKNANLGVVGSPSLTNSNQKTSDLSLDQALARRRKEIEQIGYKVIREASEEVVNKDIVIDTKNDNLEQKKMKNKKSIEKKTAESDKLKDKKDEKKEVAESSTTKKMKKEVPYEKLVAKRPGDIGAFDQVDILYHKIPNNNLKASRNQLYFQNVNIFNALSEKYQQIYLNE